MQDPRMIPISPPEVLTAGWLRRNGACREQCEVFKAEWPNGGTLTPANVRRASEIGLSLDWFAENILPYEQLRQYEEATAPARKAYDEATAPARKAYEEATATAWKAYEEAKATAWKAYEEATATARKAYEEAKATARKAYEEATAPARKAYDEAKATALNAVLFPEETTNTAA